MLHACEILFSGSVRARKLAQPNKALVARAQLAGCLQLPRELRLPRCCFLLGLLPPGLRLLSLAACLPAAAGCGFSSEREDGTRRSASERNGTVTPYLQLVPPQHLSLVHFYG